MKTVNGRTAEYPIDEMFLERWSPRAFTREPISEDDLFTMLEAARWAASSGNLQPWRFVYAHRDTASWEKFLNLLRPDGQPSLGEGCVGTGDYFLEGNNEEARHRYRRCPRERIL